MRCLIPSLCGLALLAASLAASLVAPICAPIRAYAQDEMEAAPDQAPVQKSVEKAAPKPAGKPDTKLPDAAPPQDESAPPPPPLGTMEDMPYADLQALDKITARVSRLEVAIDAPTTFGSLNVVVKACRKAPPEDTPESAAFLQVWEQKPGEDSRWVYSGWMFASSPALAAMDHPVYDIWLVDCKKAATSAASPAASPASPPAQ